VIRTATGVDPIVTGKPELPLHRETILRTGAERPLIVGDRLDTDIEGANNGGADSLLVLTGVTDARALLDAPPPHRPTYLAEDLSGLLVPHPEVRHEDGSYRCGGWTIGPDFTMSGSGERVDAVRALCVAAWESGEPAKAEKALTRLS
jgi:glycerol-1-phosphatase